MVVPHISFQQRKGLALRLMALPLLQQHESRMLQAGAEAHLRLLREQIAFLATKALDSPPTERLDSNLRSLAGELHEQMSLALAGALSHLLDPFVTQLTAQTTQLSCSTCSCIPNAVCDGGPNDDVLVARGGHCIALLQKLFDSAFALAERAFCQHLPGVRLPTVEFSTAYCNRKPHDIPVEFFCGGKTIFGPDGNSVVQLHVTPAALDWDSCLASLYVLVHECFCHAFYGARNPSRREETGNDDPFTEGWMDWLAGELLSQNAGLISNLPASGSEFTRVGIIFTEKRSQFRPKDSERVSVHAKAVALGKAAAVRMLGLLSRLPESGEDATAALFRLSCDILAEGFSLNDHEKLVFSINLGLPGAGELETPEQFESIPQCTRKYLKTLDVVDFVGSASR